MKKRILSLLLCLVLCLSLLSVTAFAATPLTALHVGGTDLNDTALASDQSGTGWSWDAAAKKLTLNGYDGGYIEATGDLSIVLADDSENTVTVPSGVDKYGIYTTGDCTISGSGNLSITTAKMGIASQSGDVFLDIDGELDVSTALAGIYAYNNVRISGDGKLTVSVTGSTNCIQTWNEDIEISDAVDVTIESAGAGIWARRDLNISTSGDLNVTTGSHGIHANKITISGDGDRTFSGNGGFAVNAVNNAINISGDGKWNISGYRLFPCRC